MNRIKELTRKAAKVRELSAVFFLAAMFLIVGMINSDFLTGTSILNCFNDSVVFTLLACGITFVILTGEIDVSIGAVLGLSAAVSSAMLRDGMPWAAAVAAGLCIGMFIGLINGAGVSLLGIPSLIFTLGVNGVVRGGVYLYTGGAWVENLPAWFTRLSSLKLAGSLTVFYFVVFAAVCALHYILTSTKAGRYFIAVGDNAAGSLLVGIPVRRTKTLAYVLCGFFAAAAGICYSSRIGFITPLAGNGYEMKAIAACVLGGVSLSGGQGSLLGAALGAVIISSVSRILVFLGFSSNLDNTITGCLLIAIVVIDALAQRHAAVRTRRARLLAKVLETED